MKEVLDSLLSLSATAATGIPQTETALNHPHLVGSVTLAGAGVSGSVHLALAEEFVEHAAGILLGKNHAATRSESVINDLTGELANMVAGRVAADLGRLGFPCSLGIPSVVRGAGRAREPEPAEDRARTHWTCRGHRITLEVRCRYLPT